MGRILVHSDWTALCGLWSFLSDDLRGKRSAVSGARVETCCGGGRARALGSEDPRAARSPLPDSRRGGAGSPGDRPSEVRALCVRR